MATSVRSVSDMSADKVKFRGVGVAFTAFAGATTVNDYKLTAARLIDGIQFLAKDHVFGDSVSVSVVDVDNVIGYGAGVVLDTFATGWYLSESQDQGQIRLPYSAEVLTGLYLRITYVSVGTSNVQVKYNLFAHMYMS
jgi:hypothetical protein